MGVHDFFKKQFRSLQKPQVILLADQQDKKISEAANQSLVAPFSEQEVLEAISSCNNSKSPGPDGFNFKFVK